MEAYYGLDQQNNKGDFSKQRLWMLLKYHILIQKTQKLISIVIAPKYEMDTKLKSIRLVLVDDDVMAYRNSS